MILVAYGTRPEIIKLFPLVQELKRQSIPFMTLFTGQHLDLYEDVKNLMPVPDYSCGGSFLSGKSLGESFCSICGSVERIISENRFRLVVIQGDTTTACAIATVAFYNRVWVAHVEAGLRTDDISAPFPEEANR